MSRIINPITFILTKKQHKAVSDHYALHQNGIKLKLMDAPVILQDDDGTYDFMIRHYIFRNKENNKKFKVVISYYKKNNGNYAYNEDENMQDLTVIEV